MKSKYLPTAFAGFGLMCGVFGFFTEISDKYILISSAFYLQLGILSLLAAIYFKK